MSEPNQQTASELDPTAAVENSNPQERIVIAIEQEIKALLDQRSEIARRIASARRTLDGLTVLFARREMNRSAASEQAMNAAISTDAALIDACRRALSESTILTTQQIRDRLRFEGLSLAEDEDPAAVVAATLHYLQRSGQVRYVILPNGNHGWEWRSKGETKQPRTD